MLFTTGTFIAGAGTMALAGSTPASASVSTYELDIPPAEREGEDGSVTSVDLTVYGAYEFAVNAADSYDLTLQVAPHGDEQNYQEIDAIHEAASANSGAGQYTLNGSILDHDAMDAADFSAEPDETVTNDLPVMVGLTVYEADETVVQAVAESIATVEVTNTSIDASATLTGEGEIGIEV